jgi:hypothetical protein
MNTLLLGSLIACIFIILIYIFTGIDKIIDCYKLWFSKDYWTSYNIVEAISWFAKAIIIVPGLIFNIEIWWLYFFALITSLSLIWASNKKLLPTLVGFNSLWVWMSCVVLAKHLL